MFERLYVRRPITEAIRDGVRRMKGARDRKKETKSFKTKIETSDMRRRQVQTP